MIIIMIHLISNHRAKSLVEGEEDIGRETSDLGHKGLKVRSLIVDAGGVGL